MKTIDKLVRNQIHLQIFFNNESGKYIVWFFDEESVYTHTSTYDTLEEAQDCFNDAAQDNRLLYLSGTDLLLEEI